MLHVHMHTTCLVKTSSFARGQGWCYMLNGPDEGRARNGVQAHRRKGPDASRQAIGNRNTQTYTCTDIYVIYIYIYIYMTY